MKIFLLLFSMTLSVHFVQSQCYVYNYSNSKRELKVDDEYAVSYSTYKRLLKFDNQYVIRYSDYKRIARVEGSYLVDYTTNKRIAKLDCPNRRSAMAAAAYFLY